MFTLPIILLGKAISSISRLLNKGNGSTWPGHIALTLDKHFLKHIITPAKVTAVFVIGTNGKTTTSRMLATILKSANLPVFQNTAGANLLNGIASTLIANTTVTGRLKKGYAIFEVDEFTVPLLLEQVTPDAIIVLNLFRDQLDRYGELDSIASRWKKSFQELPKETTLILNADDPLVAYLGNDLPVNKAQVRYFGLEEKTKKKVLQHAADSIYCPRCHEKLIYNDIYYSHLGKWHCEKCGLQRPRPDISHFSYPLPGTYNKYNTLAAITYAKAHALTDAAIEKALMLVTPAFGRQESVQYNGKQIQIFLSKNPTSLNESLSTIKTLGAKTVLLVLNDRIPDGRDVSWIWDVDFEEYLEEFDRIFLSGDRVYDLALRLQYCLEISNVKFPMLNFQERVKLYESLESAVNHATQVLPTNEKLYILPTYSAMLEVRKVITGKKIL